MDCNGFKRQGITLVELLFAISLLGVLVLYFSALEQIGRRNLVVIDRTSKAQNDAVFFLEHIVKILRQTVGNPTMTLSGTNINPIRIINSAPGKIVKFITDSNRNGRWDEGTDKYACYRIRESLYQVRFNDDYNNYGNNNCGGGEILATNITGITITPALIGETPFSLASNVIQISITACFDPAAGTCGAADHPENPQVTVTTQVAMPMVSVH